MDIQFSWFSEYELESLFSPRDLWKFYYHKNDDSIVISQCCLRWQEPADNERTDRDRARRALLLALLVDVVSCLRVMSMGPSEISEVIMLLHDQDIPTCAKLRGSIHRGDVGYCISDEHRRLLVNGFENMAQDPAFRPFFEKAPLDEALQFWRRSIILGFKHISGRLYTITKGPIKEADRLMDIAARLR